MLGADDDAEPAARDSTPESLTASGRPPTVSWQMRESRRASPAIDEGGQPRVVDLGREPARATGRRRSRDAARSPSGRGASASSHGSPPPR